MADGPRAILFDLDDTLFDHTYATRSALADLHAGEPGFGPWTLADLEAHHREVLEIMHVEVLTGRSSIDGAREERFRRLLAAAGVETGNERAAHLARQYREAYERAWRPVPGALDVVARLKRRGLAIAIVTNNLRAEQEQKLARCGLDRHVDTLVTSEEVGVAKPDARMFQTALDRLQAGAHEAVMVGDAWATDILGARAAGVRAVWFNRRGGARPDDGVVELRDLEPADAVFDALGLPAHG